MTAADLAPVPLPGSTPMENLAARFAALGSSTGGRDQRGTAAAAFIARFGNLTGWSKAAVPDRLAVPVAVRGFAAWAALADQTPVDAGYLAAAGTSWGCHAAHVHPAFAATFTACGRRLGFGDQELQRQWAVLAKLAAAAGVDPARLHRHRFDAARDQLLAAVAARQGGSAPNSLTTPLHGLEATLAALGVLTDPRPKAGTTTSRRRHWDELGIRAPVLTTTMRRYLTQLGISLRPGSVELIDTSLRHLADYLTTHHPEVDAVAAIRRTHIEGFKAWLVARPGYRGRREPVKTTLGMRLSHLRGFFDRIIEWGYPDAPARNPVFTGDAPIRDRPLPRFLDDAAAAALLTAARALPELFDRVCVEVLARTGVRKGEFLGLTTDAVVTIGDGQWLRTPVGKLHTDRYIPLHPRVHTLLGRWLEHRGDRHPSRLMFHDRGRPIPPSRVDRAVRLAANAAGLGHVTPHQLRHTLATQAINRGMSLEAIAALLGHRTMTMTMTYARIADRTVAEEYFAVSEKVEALYQADPLPADAEGPNMRRLRAETTRRLLGNGYCSRPTELGCRYETICETCSFFAPNIGFRDTLQAQHDDAADHGDTHRQNVYAKILTGLDGTAS